MICPHCGRQFLRPYPAHLQEQILSILRGEGYPMTTREIEDRMSCAQRRNVVGNALCALVRRGLVCSVPAGLGGRQNRTRLWALYPEDAP